MTTERLDTEVTLHEFFEGVAEMRAYLDRNSSQSGRELLTRMALDLTKPRSLQALCQWFCDGLVRALAARGAALLFATGANYVVQVTAGAVRSIPLVPDSTQDPGATTGGMLMPLLGAHAPFGAVWVEHDDPLDASLDTLLTAVVDAVAISLESLRERTCLT